ncbi:MAG: hypothetical protein JWN95_2183 [Frankiales bacterium]|nr:hypothetical protein [Frankiales bacterium]
MVAFTDPTLELDVRLLDASDRCDRCSARAVVETAMHGGSSLVWCGHHYGQFADALSGMGAVILIDQREL